MKEVTKNLYAYILIIHSEHPKVSDMHCLVPGCTRSWHLSGSNQGFVKSAGMTHCATHWYKFHIEHSHKAKYIWGCPDCILASEEEENKRYP